MIEPILIVRWAHGQPLIFCKWLKLPVLFFLSSFFCLIFLLIFFLLNVISRKQLGKHQFKIMILIVAVVSWSISAVGNFAFCLCTSACLHASPTNQACSAHLWNSGNLMRLGGWGDGEDFVGPALTCGLFVLKWCLPNVTCCCPGTEECGICAWQVPAEKVAGLVLPSSFGDKILQVSPRDLRSFHGVCMGTSMVSDNLAPQIDHTES